MAQPDIGNEKKMMENTRNVTIVMPSYKEEECLNRFLPEIFTALKPHDYSATVLIVNDLGERDPALEKISSLYNTVLINTPYNMGSQEAIVYGIRHQAKHSRSDLVLVIDADGQDDARAVPVLLNKVEPHTIVVAQRIGKRPEGVLFGCLYFFYKKIFYYLTNIVPDFGNFSAYDQSVADHIARSPYFNITYSMALPLVGKITKVPVTRLKRLSGKSKIGSQGLFNHAIRSTLPHLDVIAMRIAILSSVPTFAGLALVIVSSFLRIFEPEYAFPNWATTIAFGVMGMSLQLFTVCLILFLTASLYRQIASSKSDL